MKKYQQHLNSIYPNLKKNNLSKQPIEQKATRLKSKLATATSLAIPALTALVPLSELEATIIHNQGFSSPITVSGFSTGTSIDINNDGNSDIGMGFYPGPYPLIIAFADYALQLDPTYTSGPPFAARLASGVCIPTSGSALGAGGYLGAYGPMPPSGTPGTFGPWTQGSTGYLGLIFMHEGEAHAGWIEISVDYSVPSFQITGWAYEDIPMTLIAAGQTSGISFDCNPGLQDASVPTLSEWGIITLFLSIFATGAAFIARGRAALAGVGQQIQVNNRRFPFDKALFGKTLLGTLGVMTALFATAMLVFGYELTAADIPGILITSPLIAYVVHLMRR